MTAVQTLPRHIDRLQKRLDYLHRFDRRFVQARILVFILGFIASLASWLLLPRREAWAVILVSLLSYGLVVFFHRRLDARRHRLKVWKDWRHDQLARCQLDWAQMRKSQRLPYSERIALDIDLDLTGPRSLHQLIDLAVSEEGSDRLARWLVEPATDPAEVLARQGVARELKLTPRFIDRLLLNLREISAGQLKGENLLAWLKIPVEPNRLLVMLLINTIFNLTTLILLWLNLGQGFPAYWVFSLGATWVFITYGATTIKEYLEAVVDLDRELDPFSKLLIFLERYPLPAQPRLAQACAAFRRPDCLPSRHLRRVKTITAGVGVASNPVIGLLLNLVLPWNFFFSYQVARLRAGTGDLLHGWLEAWYQLEALISLGNFAALNPDFCFPQVSPAATPIFEAGDIAHPLIPAAQRVGNDFTIADLGQVALVTGSNMAGKSTFLKTVGINLCLAYAGGPACAQRMSAIPLRLHTCMRISDSISDGYSYFYAEVRCLRRLLDRLDEPPEHAPPLLYLIDEIFRGTNNRERMIGGQAYTRALIGARGTGLIATHDLELAHLAEGDPRVSNFHFRDEVGDGRLIFDYRIHPGPSPTTNALKIMEMEGLPVE